MDNISIIIPIHQFNDVISNYLDKSIESIVKQEEIDNIPKLIMVYPTDIDSDIKVYMKKWLNDKINILFVKNEGNTDYQSQVNLAVDSVDTKFFSVLEFDDELSTTYIKNVNKHIESYSDVDIFLTMIVMVNKDNQGIKLGNEMVWAQQFVGENGDMGYLNTKSLNSFSDFKLSGAVINKEEFINIGKYKTKIKLTFMYEFLLRALNNTCKIFTIPKIGYKHLMDREGSLFDYYKNNMPINERKFWFEVATNEANFMNDRDIDMSRLEIKTSEK